MKTDRMLDVLRLRFEALVARFGLQNRLNPATRLGKFFRALYSSLPALFIIFMCLLLLVLFMLVGAKKSRIELQRKNAMKKERPAVNVVIQRLEPSPIRDRLDLPAIVEPWEELPVRAEVSGRVITINVAEGQNVKKGTILAVIDKRDYQAALKSARASYTLANLTFERTERLHKKGSSSKSAYDTAVANKEKSLAALNSAELSLERTEIRAPLSGIVNRLDAKLGLLLSHSDPVAEIISINPVKVSVGIPEADVNEVRSLVSFGVTVGSLNDNEFVGTRHFLSKKPGSLAHLYELELEVPNPEGLILPGMFARVDVVKSTVEDALSVPVYAVITQGGDKVVYLEDGGLATRRIVTTGVLEGWNVQITAGVESGERVIVVGHRSVGEGQPLNVIREITSSEELLR